MYVFINKQTWNKGEVQYVEYKETMVIGHWSVVQAAQVQSKTLVQHCLSKVMKQRKEDWAAVNI